MAIRPGFCNNRSREEMLKRLRRTRHFGARQWLAIAALVFVLLFTAYHAFQAGRRLIYWNQPQQISVRGWMTVSYVAKAQRVPAVVLNEAIGLPRGARDGRPLSRIAAEQNRTFDEIDVAISTAIAKYRASESEPGGQH